MKSLLDTPSSQPQAKPPQANPQAKKLPKYTPQAPQANKNGFPNQICRKINPQVNFTLIPKQSHFLVRPLFEGIEFR